MTAIGRKRTLISRSHQQFERPLSGKADIQELAVAEVVRNDGFAPPKAAIRIFEGVRELCESVLMGCDES